MGGTWSASASLWSTDSAGLTAVPGNIATATTDALSFGNSGGTVTVSGTVSAANITGTSSAGGLVISGGTIDMGSTAGVIATSATSFNISSALTGTAGLTKGGSKVLTLSGSNTYTGGTTISTNILKVGSATALGDSAGSVSITSGAALDIGGITMTNTNALTLRGTGVTSGGALMNSSATAGTYAGLVTLGSASSIIAGTGNITLSNPGTISGAFGLTVGGAKNTMIASVIGTNTLTKQDAGTLTLSGANTYTGGTTVSVGALTFLNTTAKSSSGTHAFAAGTTLGLGVSGANAFTSADVDNALAENMTGNLSGITVTSTTNVGIDTTNGNFSYTVPGSPSKTLVKLGTNTLTLTGTNASTGGTTINAGTLALGSSGALGTTGAISFGGGTLQSSTSNTTDYSARFSTANSQAYAADTNGQNITWASNLTSSGGTLTKSGTGTLTLTGANTYTGATTLNGGTLTLNRDTGSLAATALAANLGKFVYSNSNATGTQSQSMGNISFGSTAVRSGAVVIEADETGAGSATLTFATIPAATQTAGVSVNYVTTGSASIIPTAVGGSGFQNKVDPHQFINGSDYAYISAGSALRAPVYGTDTGATLITTVITSSSSTNWLLTSSNTGSGQAGGTNFNTMKISGAGQVDFTSTGAVETIGGFLRTGGGATTIGGGVSFRSATGANDIVIRTDSANDSIQMNAVLSIVNFTNGQTYLVKAGLGTLTLNANNSYGGHTTINEGTVTVTNDNGLGWGGQIGTLAPTYLAGNTTVNPGAVLDINSAAGNRKINEPIVLNGGSLINSSASNTSTLDNGVAAITLTNFGSGGGTNSGTVTIAGGTTNATASIGVTTGAMTSFTLSTAGTGYTSTPNVSFTITGQTTPAAATATLSSLALTGTSNTIGGAGNLVINAVVADGTSSGGFSKTGAGAVTLNGVNTYTGNTAISAGTLALGSAGTFANSPIINLGTSGSQGTLNLTAKSSFAFGSGQTLSGYGTVNIGSNNLITLDGTLAPGNSAGIVAVTGDFTLGSASTTNMEIVSRIGAAGTAFDQLTVSGALTFNGTLNIITTGLTGLAAGDSFKLFDATGSYTSGFTSVVMTGAYAPAFTGGSGIWTGTDAGLLFTFTESNGTLSLANVAIPEPSSCAALVGAAMLSLSIIRRRRV